MREEECQPPQTTQGLWQGVAQAHAEVPGLALSELNSASLWERGFLPGCVQGRGPSGQRMPESCRTGQSFRPEVFNPRLRNAHIK